MPVGLDLGAFGDLETEADERVLEPLPGLRHEVRVATGRSAGELGEVETFGGDPLVERRRAERRAAIFERRGDGGHGVVDGLAGRLLLVDRVERAEARLELGEFALLAGEPGGQFVDLVERRRSVDRRERRVASGSDVGEHVWPFEMSEWGTETPDELRTWPGAMIATCGTSSPVSPGARKSLQLRLHGSNPTGSMSPGRRPIRCGHAARRDRRDGWMALLALRRARRSDDVGQRPARPERRQPDHRAPGQGEGDRERQGQGERHRSGAARPPGVQHGQGCGRGL